MALLQPRRNSTINEEDFNSLIRENLPNWNATWSMLLQMNKNSNKDMRNNGKKPKSTKELHEKISRKISELVDEEEALINLYTKAADDAKKEEMEFRNKTNVLMEQLKKDKNLLNTFKESK